MLSNSEKATSPPPAAHSFPARRCGYNRTQIYHVTGREDRHAPPNSVTRHHRHGLYAPRPSRRARRGALRGDSDPCRHHQTTKPFMSGYLLEVQLPSCPRWQAAVLWPLRRFALLQQAVCQRRLGRAQARVREHAHGTSQGTCSPRSAGGSQARF